MLTILGRCWKVCFTIAPGSCNPELRALGGHLERSSGLCTCHVDVHPNHPCLWRQPTDAQHDRGPVPYSDIRDPTAMLQIEKTISSTMPLSKRRLVPILQKD